MKSSHKLKPTLAVAPKAYPFTSNKMIDAACFLAAAVSEAKAGKARFVLFGDFDVDGTASAAILSLYLNLYGVKAVSVFLSKRQDGYGLSRPSLDRLMADLNGIQFSGTTYVVLMDLGVNTTAEAEILLQSISSTAVIVIDHHVPTPTARTEWETLGQKYTGRVMAYDPLLFAESDERYFRCLSAAGLVQRLNEIICDSDIMDLGAVAKSKIPATLISSSGVKKTVSRRTVFNTIDKIAAIAQASDVMPFAIDGELTAAWAMAKKFEDTSGSLLAGVAELYKKTNTASRIGWVIGPILNAAGRLEDAYASFDLMTEIIDIEAVSKMEAIEITRTKVQSITASATISLDDSLRTDKGVAVLVLDGSQIGAGIVGITASRSCDRYGRPSVCMIESKDDSGRPVLKGSMRRGQTTFSCEAWILELKTLGIAIAGGGHPAAAGMTILTSRYDEFLAHASSQSFESTAPSVYHFNINETHSLLRDIEKVMPFGNGNVSPRIRLSGVVTAVKPLVRRDDGVVWCYVLHVAETNDVADFVDVKVMARDVSENVALMLNLMANKPVSLPIVVEIEAFDGFKVGYAVRGEYRLTTSIRSDFTISRASDQWMDLRSETESGSFAHLLISLNETTVPDTSKTLPLELRIVEVSPPTSLDTTDQSLPAATTTDAGVVSYPDKIISGSSDIAMISAFLESASLDPNTYKITCTVDHDPSLSAGTFLVKRPGKQETEAMIGPEAAERLSAAHGGRWTPELKGYIISAGTVLTLAPCPQGDFHFIYTRRALETAAAVDAINAQTIVDKSDTSPFAIPFLAPSKVPFGFQYADVRLFLTRDVSLCYNDMGTGKTFESAIWGAMKYAASGTGFDIPKAIRENRLGELEAIISGIQSSNVDRNLIPGARPVLVATMASIAIQFAKELEAFLTIKTTVLSTDAINDLIEASGVKLTKKERSVTQLKAPNPKLIAYFKAHVFTKSAFVVATYDALSRHPWIVSSCHWSGLICDEAHELKGSSTHKTKALFGEGIDRAPLLHGQEYVPVLAMSGTFPKNRPGDWFVWTRLTAADSGVYSSGSVSDAQRRFDKRFDGLFYKEIWLKRGGGPPRKITVPAKGPPEHGDEIKAILAPFIVRRLKDEVDDLPPMKVHVHRIKTNGLYLDVIANMRSGRALSDASVALLSHHKLLNAKQEFVTESPTGGGLPSMKDLALAGKLSMVSSLDKASSVVDTISELGWTKTGTTDAFAVIVFHRSALAEASRQLALAGISHFTMSQDDTIEEREAKKTAFQSGERMAFLTSYGVGGTGLNLTRASRMIMIGLPWTDTALAQARDRIFRIGQTKPTTIVIALLKGSIDESTYYLIKHKGRANFKTAAVDKLRTKGGSIPAWATGSVLDHVDRLEENEGEAPEESTIRRPGSSWLS